MTLIIDDFDKFILIDDLDDLLLFFEIENLIIKICNSLKTEK